MALLFLQVRLSALEHKNPYNSDLRKGMRSVPRQEFMAEDLGEEDIVGLVFGFELVATDGAVGASEVALVSGEVEGAEGGGNVLGELGSSGGG
jgi:hypothetical protein